MRKIGVVILLVAGAGWCWGQAVEEGAKPRETPAVEKEAGAPDAEKAKPLTNEELRTLLEDYRVTASAEEQGELALTLNARVKDRCGELLERIEKGKGEERLEAIELVGFARKAEVTPVLVKLAKSEDVEVSRRAVDALGVNGDPKALEALTAVLDGKDSALAGRAAIAMGRIGDVAAMPVMLEELKRTQDLVEKLSLIRGLGLLKDERVLGALQEELAASDNPLVQTAIYDAVNLIMGDDAGRIADQLEQIAAVLKEHGGDWQTQLAQAAVTDALDRLIKQAEESQSQSKQGGGKKRQTSKSGQKQGQKTGGASGKSQQKQGKTPASSEDSPERASENPDGTPGHNPAAGVAWGNLPPAVREEVTAALKSDLPERYRRFLEIYYKILAEGR